MNLSTTGNRNLKAVDRKPDTKINTIGRIQTIIDAQEAIIINEYRPVMNDSVPAVTSKR